MNKVLIPVLAVVAAGSATFGIMQMNAAGEASKERDAVNEKFSAQDKALAKALADYKKAMEDLRSERENVTRLIAERDLAKSKAKELAANAENNAGLTNVAEEKNGAERGQKELRNFAQNLMKQMDDPQVRAGLKSQQTERIAKVYGDLFKKMNLSPDDAKLVAELISDRNMAAMDKGRKLMGGQADEAGIDAVRKDVEGTKAEYDSKLKGVLGEDKFAELDAHERTIGDQRALDGIARTFERENSALQPDQRTALSDIMRTERLKIPSNNIPDLNGGPGMSALLSDADSKAQQQQEEKYQESVINQAPSAGLSPDQVNLLKDSFKKQNEQKAVGRAFGRAFLGGGIGGGGRNPR